MGDVVISTFAERPEYVQRVHEMADLWPDFMGRDATANALLGQVIPAFPQLGVVATVDGAPIARGRAIPFALHVDGRRELPDGGWDRVLVWGMDDRADGAPTDTVSALEIAIDPRHLGTGLSGRMLAAMRTAAIDAGFAELVAPVRPNGKHLMPEMPMAEYVQRTRRDGLPEDPWLRVHVRAGASIASMAPASMAVAGSLAQWRTWTGLPFDTSGPVLLPQALVPVHCDVDHDVAVYVEPNVWVRHPLR